MKFEKYIPSDSLKSYIKHYVISESALEGEYKVLPSTGLVIGFQYKGQLTSIQGNNEHKLSPSGITGMSDTYKLFKTSPNIGSILVYFTEVGYAHFSSVPANELFNLSISLGDVFEKQHVIDLEEKLTSAISDKIRIKILEQFLLSQLKVKQADKIVVEAVKMIYLSGGTLQIKDLIEKLYLSQSAFEKRFRKVVGATPKKFASIVRFNTVLNQLNSTKSLSEICYENNFFDQAHFIKDFKQFTGDTPENFKRFL